MKDKAAIVFYYNKPNRNSINALVGAIENEEGIDTIPLYLLYTKEELCGQFGSIAGRAKNVIVCFSFLTTQVFEMKGILDHVRSVSAGNIITIAGGAHPTALPVDVLRMGFDFVVRGEGEGALISILKRIVDERPVKNIPGIFYLDGQGEIASSPAQHYLDLDRYPSIAVKHRLYGPIELTRGCPHACTFCQLPYMEDSTVVRHRSVENVCAHIEQMRRAGIGDFSFISTNTLSYGSEDGRSSSRRSLEQLLEGMRNAAGKDGNIFLGSFPSEVRPELVTPEVCELLSRYVDNKKLVIGAQSGSDRLLEQCRRNHTVTDVYNATENALTAGFEPHLDFLFGIPGETEEDDDRSMKAIEKLVHMGAAIHVNTYIPLPSRPQEASPSSYRNSRLRQFLRTYTGKGILYGQWEKQEATAHRIERYLKKPGCPL
ncbi:MAG: TIGR04013 family B12-binding domain/radical SAM domain-containing protein [Spirochaetales bacterium]|nr:TIGR04013 family B12-binding domain/radical SAM domain-containing protein [Spirochaetales bacterium]